VSSSFRRSPTAPAPQGGAAPPALSRPDADADDHAVHCGWFDSSHDLRTGLLVQEHVDGQDALAWLPLQEWLRLHLAGWSGPQALSGDTARR